jgi:hypothetical protein
LGGGGGGGLGGGGWGLTVKGGKLRSCDWERPVGRVMGMWWSGWWKVDILAAVEGHHASRDASGEDVQVRKRADRLW